MAILKKTTLPLSILLIITIIIALYYFLDYNGYLSLFTQPSSIKNKIATNGSLSPSPIPSRSPYPLIPDSGTAGTYNISQPPQPGPEFTHITIDPLDAKLNEPVILTAVLNHSESVDYVKSTIETDQHPLSFNLEFVSQSGTSQTWRGEFILSEPILYKYIYHLEAKSMSGTTSLPMALRN